MKEVVARLRRVVGPELPTALDGSLSSAGALSSTFHQGEARWQALAPLSELDGATRLLVKSGTRRHLLVLDGTFTSTLTLLDEFAWAGGYPTSPIDLADLPEPPGYSLALDVRGLTILTDRLPAGVVDLPFTTGGGTVTFVEGEEESDYLVAPLGVVPVV